MSVHSLVERINTLDPKKHDVSTWLEGICIAIEELAVFFSYSDRITLTQALTDAFERFKGTAQTVQLNRFGERALRALAI
jgi:hypothetical protein